MRLLLVEDDRELVELLAVVLRGEGHSVDVALDGQRGLHLALTRPYDVVVIDRGLPVLDGLDAGADDYLMKPFDLGELFARLRALGRRAAELAAVLRIGAGRLELEQHRVVLPDGELVRSGIPRRGRWIATDSGLVPPISTIVACGPPGRCAPTVGGIACFASSRASGNRTVA